MLASFNLSRFMKTNKATNAILEKQVFRLFCTLHIDLLSSGLDSPISTDGCTMKSFKILNNYVTNPHKNREMAKSIC